MKQINLTPEEQDAERKSYPELFKAREQGYGGYTFPKIGRSVYEDTPEVREKTLQECWDKGNFSYWVANYDNILLDKYSNRVVYDFWVKKVRERLTDPKKMEILAPLEPPHPFGVKRPSLEQDYYEMLDKPTVEIVPVKNNPIVEIKENGIVTADGNFYEVDVIALATGFDALTGSLIDAGIKDVNGTLIKELWKDGCKTFYGITMHGFPNMFFTYGPQAPTSFTNGPTLIEIQARFIMDAIAKMEAEGIKYIDPLPEAQESFVEGIHQAASHTLFPLADSWYMGANIPGKKREMLNYMGGIPRYTEEINELLKQDFIGFNVVKEKA
uniref:Uncharacterized protein n=1 Tax=Panagrolaimus sp. JU765 TaxID=591449 RepID=A0AC34QBF7_9BILA